MITEIKRLSIRIFNILVDGNENRFFYLGFQYIEYDGTEINRFSVWFNIGYGWNEIKTAFSSLRIFNILSLMMNREIKPLLSSLRIFNILELMDGTVKLNRLSSHGSSKYIELMDGTVLKWLSKTSCDFFSILI
ncbi:hypothetical protein TNCT_729791 [Trichonephila clavata]|uniref:Uncharacterized protein n=1 Tax=Trichonephila clavata TaxID=2740835 RepID=A0A8X6F169_TRICU|nr:hypothetical protein TNCT_729791 [Trichonephila clavata]